MPIAEFHCKNLFTMIQRWELAIRQRLLPEMHHRIDTQNFYFLALGTTPPLCDAHLNLPFGRRIFHSESCRHTKTSCEKGGGGCTRIQYYNSRYCTTTEESISFSVPAFTVLTCRNNTLHVIGLNVELIDIWICHVLWNESLMNLVITFFVHLNMCCTKISYS